MGSTKVIVLLSCALALPSAVHAQTWVSNTGSDSNACTLTAPCKTFQRAVNETPAYGQVRVLNAGDYGPVVLTTSIQIDGGGLGSITLTGTTTTAAVQVNTPSGGLVQLRNLGIHGYSGASTGIQDKGAGGLDIENVQVTGFAGNCIQEDQSVGSVDLVIKDTTVENCSSNGIFLSGDSSLTTSVKIINSHVRFANGGISANYVTAISVFNSTFSSPGPPTSSTNTVGIYVLSGPTHLLLDDCQVTGFGVGAFASYQSVIQVSRSSFIDNWIGVEAGSGGTVISNENNAFAGNNTTGTFSSKVALQ